MSLELSEAILSRETMPPSPPIDPALQEALSRFAREDAARLTSRKAQSTLQSLAARLTAARDPGRAEPGDPAAALQSVYGVQPLRSFRQDGESLSPVSGLAQAASGDLIVADDFNHRIQIYDASGELKSSFGKKGKSAGEFMYPKGLATDAEGHIYVADSWNHRIQKFDSRGNFLLSFGSYGKEANQLNEPCDLLVERDGRILVVERSNHRVQVFDAGGRSLGWTGCRATVIEEKLAYIYDTPPDLLAPPAFEFPAGIARDSQGHYYIADSGNHRVMKFDGDWRLLRIIGQKGVLPGQFQYPMAVTAGANDLLYVADLNNSRVQVFSPHGLWLAAFAEGDGAFALEMPSVLMTSDNGSLFVGLTFHTRVLEFQTPADSLANLYEHLAGLFPDDPQVHYGLGRHQAEKGQTTAALLGLFGTIERALCPDSTADAEFLGHLSTHAREVAASEVNFENLAPSLFALQDRMQSLREGLGHQILEYLGEVKQLLPEKVTEEQKQEHLILEDNDDPVAFNEKLLAMKKRDRELFYRSRELFWEFKSLCQAENRFRQFLLECGLPDDAFPARYDALRADYLRTGRVLKTLMAEKDGNEEILVHALQGAEQDQSRLLEFHIKTMLNQKISEVIRLFLSAFAPASNSLQLALRLAGERGIEIQNLAGLFDDVDAELFPRILLGLHADWHQHHHLEIEFTGLLDTLSPASSAAPEKAGPHSLTPLAHDSEGLDPADLLQTRRMETDGITTAPEGITWGARKFHASLMPPENEELEQWLDGLHTTQESYMDKFGDIFNQIREIVLEIPRLEQQARQVDVRDRKTPIRKRNHQWILEFQLQLLLRMFHALEINERRNLSRLIAATALLLSARPESPLARQARSRLLDRLADTGRLLQQYLAAWRPVGLKMVAVSSQPAPDPANPDFSGMDEAHARFLEKEAVRHEYLEIQANVLRLTRMKALLERFREFAETAGREASIEDGSFLRFLESWGQSGPGPDQLIVPLGVAYAPDGSLHVSDYARHCIAGYSARGALLGLRGTRGNGPGAFNVPYGLCVDGAGNLLVADVQNRRIQKFARDGQWLAETESKGDDETRLETFFGVSCDAENNIWVADTGLHRVQVYSPEGRWLRTLGGTGSEALKSPWNVQCLENGEYLVSDQSDQKLKRYDAGGRMIRALETGNRDFQDLVYLAWHPRWGIFASDSWNCQIIRLDLDLKVTGIYRNPGDRVGQLFRTSGLSIHGNRLAALDFDNHRIQIFELR